jgi:hypothetical protein
MGAVMRVVPVVMCSFMLWTSESHQIHINREPAPPSIEELARAADVIAIGTIDEVRDIQRSGGPPGVTSPWMECRLNISQLVKQDTHVSPVSTALTFYIIGGHKSYEIGFRPFQKGEELLVYLKMASGIDGYVLKFGPEAAYKIANGTLRPFGRSAVARQHDGKSVGSIVAALRAVK